VVGGFVLVAWWTRRAGWRAPATAGLLLLAGGVALHLLPPAWTRPTTHSTTSPVPQSLSQQPNLVLVILDTLRQDVFREVVDRTEEGRRFHEAVPDAAWFDNAIAAAPWTAPSVGSIHTGLYPVEHGFGRRTGPGPSGFPRMDASVPTLAQYLGNRGYRTAGLVTNALLHPDSGIGRGFQRYEVLQAATHKLPILLALVKSGWIDHELYQPADVARRHLRRWLDEPAWVEAETPFFLWVHLMDPHAPYHAHPDLAPEAGSERLPESDRLYREETRFALRELTRLLEDLDRGSGLWSRTLLVIVADHGEMFASDHHFSGVIRDGKPKITGHGHAFYEELVRVPLVIRPPGGLGEERRIAGIVSHVDLFPTLVELLGYEVPLRLASRFRFSAWLDPRSSETPEGPLARREAALISMSQHGPLRRSLRTATRKLIDHPGKQRPDELYDLVEDPKEQHNLAPERPEEVAAAIALQNALWARLKPAQDTPPVELDAETRRQLRALGYLH
jgi:choline-sulfatase